MLLDVVREWVGARLCLIGEGWDGPVERVVGKRRSWGQRRRRWANLAGVPKREGSGGTGRERGDRPHIQFFHILTDRAHPSELKMTWWPVFFFQMSSTPISFPQAAVHLVLCPVKFVDPHQALQPIGRFGPPAVGGGCGCGQGCVFGNKR